MRLLFICVFRSELQIIKESFIQLFEGALKRVSQRLIIGLAFDRCQRLPRLLQFTAHFIETS